MHHSEEKAGATWCLSCHRHLSGEWCSGLRGCNSLPPSFSRLEFYIAFQVKGKKSCCLWLCFILCLALKVACTADLWVLSPVILLWPFHHPSRSNQNKAKQKGYKQIFSFFCLQRVFFNLPKHVSALQASNPSAESEQTGQSHWQQTALDRVFGRYSLNTIEQ